ncbi:MAG: lamin tail domain-containing protein, partial [Planctomycetes bacterium]|nr:lamin tail domain-containing protein [Planctomycetota bacterium]
GIPDDQGADRYSVINFLIPGRDQQGKGAYLNGNIFRDIPQRIFDHVDEDLGGSPGFETDLVMHNCLIPANRADDIVSVRLGTTMDLGQGNFVGAPLFVDPSGDFHLKASSPARNAAPGGIDLGAYAPAGAAVSGEPAPTTWRTDATLTVAGPGISDYKYRLNGGAWSGEYPVNTPIELSQLGNGESYTVEVIGKNFIGQWQSENAPGVSQTWTVDTAYSRLVINEVLAHNVSALDYNGTAPDLIELYYDGPAPLNLAGMRITDNQGDPTKYVFGAGATINPGQYLVLYADSMIGTSDIHLGFAIADRGEGVYLYDDTGSLVDSVEFGLQVVDLSIGRDDEGDWRLTQPTFGAANVVQPLGDRSTIKINEWFANGDILFVDDFIEFYNPDIYPVDLGGIYITDNPVSQPEKYQFSPLNFIAGEGFADLDADAQSDPGHVPFRLSSDLEMIAIYASDSSPIDGVLYGPQTTDVSQGRSPDGGGDYAFFTIPTPGVANPFVAGGDTIEINLIAIENEWAYDQTNTDLQTAWREYDYDDALWLAGEALLYVEGSSLPAPKNTPLTLGAPTYYFRSHFTIPSEVDVADIIELNVATVVDDGAVIYINGAEALRVGFNETTVITHNTWVDRDAVGNAAYEYFTIPATNLQPDDNVIAVEVHQKNATSSDIVFGLALDAVVDVSQTEDPMVGVKLLLDNLRITELMYHPVSGSDYEFVELQNIGTEELDLTGVRLAGGIEFTFGAQTLVAGEYVLVANNRGEFQTFYGAGLNLADGEYTGNLSNGGENITLRLAAPLRAAILRFGYNDAWYPTTDGDGYSLVIRDATAHPATWDDAESWAASTSINGSPGSAD